MNAAETQVDGNHYKDMPIQPVEYITKNGLGYCEGNVIKYISRYKKKGGKVDLEKAIHYLQLLIEQEYPEVNGSVGDDYRLLIDGEKLQAGDQYNPGDGIWYVVDESNTHRVFNSRLYVPHRRKIEKGTK